MKISKLLLVPLCFSMFCGCAAIHTSKAILSQAPDGVRVYPPAVYLFVDKTKGSQYLVGPDFSGAYDVKPFTLLAKNSFSLELTDGVLSKYTGDQDTTAFISFLSSVGQSAAKAAGAAVSMQSMPGSFGLADGIYKFNPVTSKFEKIQ
jgi:hypothetical protein